MLGATNKPPQAEDPPPKTSTDNAIDSACPPEHIATFPESTGPPHAELCGPMPVPEGTAQLSPQDCVDAVLGALDLAAVLPAPEEAPEALQRPQSTPPISSRLPVPTHGVAVNMRITRQRTKEAQALSLAKPPSAPAMPKRTTGKPKSGSQKAAVVASVVPTVSAHVSTQKADDRLQIQLLTEQNRALQAQLATLTAAQKELAAAKTDLAIAQSECQAARTAMAAKDALLVEKEALLAAKDALLVEKDALIPSLRAEQTAPGVQPTQAVPAAPSQMNTVVHRVIITKTAGRSKQSYAAAAKRPPASSPHTAPASAQGKASKAARSTPPPVWETVETKRRSYLRVQLSNPAARPLKELVADLFRKCLDIPDAGIEEVKPIRGKQYAVKFTTMEARKAVYNAYFGEKGKTTSSRMDDCIQTDNERWYLGVWHSKCITDFLRWQRATTKECKANNTPFTVTRKGDGAFVSFEADAKGHWYPMDVLTRDPPKPPRKTVTPPTKPQPTTPDPALVGCTAVPVQN